jgi:hypothetical protein
MVSWASAIVREDKDKRWTGEKGFINLNEPIFARGMRLLMKSE